MNKKTLLKTLVPLFMVVAIGIIYITQNPADTSDSSTVLHDDFVLETTSIDLDSLKSHNLPMIIDFGADECVPCKAMAPVLVSMNEEMQGKAIIKFTDVWVNPEASADFPVTVIPTQFFFNADGTPYMPSKDLGIQFKGYADSETEAHALTAHEGGLTEEQMKLILEDMGVAIDG